MDNYAFILLLVCGGLSLRHVCNPLASRFSRLLVLALVSVIFVLFFFTKFLIITLIATFLLGLYIIIYGLIISPSERSSQSYRQLETRTNPEKDRIESK